MLTWNVRLLPLHLNDGLSSLSRLIVVVKNVVAVVASGVGVLGVQRAGDGTPLGEARVHLCIVENNGISNFLGYNSREYDLPWRQCVSRERTFSPRRAPCVNDQLG